MHKMVGRVFKVVGISILLMILMDIVFIVSDTITVYNRISALSVVMQDELSRNNCIPGDPSKPDAANIRNLFDNQLRDIVRKSNIAVDITWNLDKSLTSKGVLYPPINQDNVKQYGDMLHLVIQVKMQPHSLLFIKNTSTNGGSFLTKSLFTYVNVYEYAVPALRYLK